jgi:hypothetical protein
MMPNTCSRIQIERGVVSDRLCQIPMISGGSIGIGGCKTQKSNHIQMVAAKREGLHRDGAKEVKVRDVQRRLSKKTRPELSKERIAEILGALHSLENSQDLFYKIAPKDASLIAQRQAKIELLQTRAATFLERWAQR